jgi:uncharacterized protein (TIGR03083 family)
METAAFVDVLRREGVALVDAAEKAGLDADVPSCPGWRVRDLVAHQGRVHRWAAAFVAEGRKEIGPIAGDAPGDDSLTAWFREGHARLVGTLTAAPPDVDCAVFFLDAPSPLAFWARRQAHETTVHRVDAELALGDALSPVGPEFAADGVDEMLAGFHARPKSRVRSERPRTLRVRAVDVPEGPADWLVRLSQEPPAVEYGSEQPADCTLSGTASALYLALWNRGPYEALEVAGDESLVALWRHTGAIG